LIVSGLGVGLFRTTAVAQQNQQTHQREVLQRRNPRTRISLAVRN
jgi:hypothetical protein